MAGVIGKRRRDEAQLRRAPKKKANFKKQKVYHSSSEEDSEDETVAHDAPVVEKNAKRNRNERNGAKSILKKGATKLRLQAQTQESEDDSEVDKVQMNTALNMNPDNDEHDGDSDDDDEPQVGSDDVSSSASDEDDFRSETSSTASQLKKRNDPSAFATSITRILDTKLTVSKRADPVLSRSKTAVEANKSLTDNRLEQQARAQLRAEKKASQDKGRIRDVLGLETADVDTGAMLEEEKRLKKVAQRGVVRLFNAVRAAQVKAEQGMREAREQNVVGMKQREERMNEMSKQGFLDLISSGGRKTASV